VNTSIDKILKNYWDGNSTTEEEKLLREYFRSNTVSEEHESLIPLFKFYDQEKELSIGDRIHTDFARPEPKVRRMKFIIPQLMAIAASMLILVAVGLNFLNVNDTMYKNKYTELEDPDEALAITMEALGFLSNKYESGSQPMTKYMKNFEKTSIIKLN